MTIGDVYIYLPGHWSVSMMNSPISLLGVLLLSPSRLQVSGAIPALISEPKENSNEERDKMYSRKLTLILRYLCSQTHV